MEDRPSTGSRAAFVGLFLIAVALGLGFVVWLSTCAGDSRFLDVAATRSAPAAGTIEAESESSPAPQPVKVGIVAGHWQSDSGAVCPDGLTEVTINLDVASRTAAILRSEGYAVRVLPEFAPDLSGYVADAFVSIHTDSCDVPGASGFKVARVSASAIPAEEDRLVECLIVKYGEATGLVFHESVTYDMTQYHAFGEIDPLTPAAIIELGFMGADRWLLTENSYEVARGIARGIACFLEGD